MNENTVIQKRFDEFKAWLIENRKSVVSSLRKYRAVKSYSIAAALASIITLSVLCIKEGGSTGEYIGIVFSLLVLIFSDKLAMLLSSLSGFRSLPIVSLEYEKSFLKDIETFSVPMKVDLSLIDPSLLRAAIYGSKRKVIKLPVFLSCCIEIADLIESSEQGFQELHHVEHN